MSQAQVTLTDSPEFEKPTVGHGEIKKATQIRDTSSEEEHDETAERSSDDETDAREAAKQSAGANDLENKDDKPDTASEASVVVGGLDVGELPEIELEPSEDQHQVAVSQPEISTSARDTDRLSIAVSSDHETDNEDSRSRSDRADTVSVKSSSSSHTEQNEKSAAILLTSGSEAPVRSQDQQPASEVKDPQNDATEKLQHCQKELEDLRERLKGYEEERAAGDLDSKLRDAEEKNQELKKKLGESEILLGEAKTHQTSLDEQIRALEAKQSEELLKKQEEVTRLETSLAELKGQLEEKARNQDPAEKNGLQLDSKANDSRTSLRPAATKKASKICVII